MAQHELSAVIDLEAGLDEGIPCHPNQVIYVYFPFKDEDVPTLYKLHAIARLGAALIQSGERVLVHCQMGLNRSALVAGLVLVYNGLSGEAAVAAPPGAPAGRALQRGVRQLPARAARWRRLLPPSTPGAAGKTAILQALFARTGGVYLTSREFVEASAHRDPLSLDETVYGVLTQALETHDTVIVDDFQLVSGRPTFSPASTASSRRPSRTRRAVIFIDDSDVIFEAGSERGCTATC